MVKRTQGMRWLRNSKRLALYLLYGMTCSYCKRHYNEVGRLTADHLHPYELGGSNDESNLVCACVNCNSKRGLMDWKEFIEKVELPEGVSTQDVIDFIEEKRQQALDRKKALEILKEAGDDWKVALSLAAEVC